MKHDFCLAGLLTYLGLLCLPTLLYRQWPGEISKLNQCDEAYSSGTVQDFHLIPFSSVSPLMEVAETKHDKGRERNRKYKRKERKMNLFQFRQNFFLENVLADNPIMGLIVVIELLAMMYHIFSFFQ